MSVLVKAQHSGICPAWHQAAGEPAWLFLDEHPDSINDGYFITDPNANTWQDLPACYHNGACGFAFADGHSEIHKWKDPRTKPLVGYGNGLPLNVASPNNPDIAWLAQNTTVRR